MIWPILGVAACLLLGFKTVEMMVITEFGLVEALWLLCGEVKAYRLLEFFVILNLLWVAKLKIKPRIKVRKYELRR